jgi:hypothetical protein
MSQPYIKTWGSKSPPLSENKCHAGLGGTVENLNVRFDPGSLDQRQCIILIHMAPPDDGHSVKNNAALNLVFSQLPNLVIRGGSPFYVV